MPGAVVAVLIAGAVVGVLAYYSLADWWADRRERAWLARLAWDEFWRAQEASLYAEMQRAEPAPDWFDFACDLLADLESIRTVEPQRELRS